MVNLLSIIALGFFLGMRHATDPDHVIAVTTIVSRQRSILKSAAIGAFWGVGHTLTIFAVGVVVEALNLLLFNFDQTLGFLVIALWIIGLAIEFWGFGSKPVKLDKHEETGKPTTT